METRRIPDGQITASSQWDANRAASQGRLHLEAGAGKEGAWVAANNDANQWLQVNLVQNVSVTRVATQGRNGPYLQWVAKYKLQYSDDGVDFQYYREKGQSADKVKFLIYQIRLTSFQVVIIADKP